MKASGQRASVITQGKNQVQGALLSGLGPQGQVFGQVIKNINHAHGTVQTAFVGDIKIFGQTLAQRD